MRGRLLPPLFSPGGDLGPWLARAPGQAARRSVCRQLCGLGPVLETFWSQVFTSVRWEL